MKQKLLLKSMLLLFALIAGSSSVWATDEVYYTLTPAAGSDNGYANAEDIEIDDITWNVTGNCTLTPWRLGGKSLSGVDRTVFSKTAMGAAITEVKLKVGAASSITVNSLKLIVSTAENGGGTKIDEVSATFAANSTISFKPTSPATQWAKDAYYKFVFNVSVTGTSNKFIEFSEAKFYTPETAKTDPTITFNNGSVRVGKTLDLSTLFTSNSTGAVTYSITEGGSYASIDGTTLTGVAVGGVTVQASQAATISHNAKSATATISVVDPALSSIAITTAPTKTTYDEGDPFDPTGMVVTATFADDSKEDVTASCTWTPSGALATTDDEVTISYTYKTVTRTTTQGITVNAYTQPTSVSITNWNTLFGTSFNGSITGDDQKTYSGAKDKVTVEYAKGTGSYMYMKDGEIRLYGGTILSFTAPYGYCIKQIVFTGTIDNSKKPTANVGTYTNSTKTWKGAASTVVFTGTASNAQITSATITLSPAVPVTIGTYEWATFVSDKALDFEDLDVKAYVVTGASGTAITKTPVTKAAANTPLLLNAPAGTYTIPAAASGTDYSSSNKLVAGTGAEVAYDDNSGYNYVLSVDGDNAMFMRIVDGTPATVPADKAYLALDGNPGARGLYLFDDEETTGVNEVKTQKADGQYFNLAGQRVAQPTKGLYIVNGKKVIIK